MPTLQTTARSDNYAINPHWLQWGGPHLPSKQPLPLRRYPPHLIHSTDRLTDEIGDKSVSTPAYALLYYSDGANNAWLNCDLLSYLMLFTATLYISLSRVGTVVSSSLPMPLSMRLFCLSIFIAGWFVSRIASKFRQIIGSSLFIVHSLAMSA